MRESFPESVLLVDGDPSLRINLLMQLEEGGFEADQAEDGIEGLAKLRHKLPQVIISGLAMHGMSGTEFISVVRNRFPSIPVIALSESIPVELPAKAQPDIFLEKDRLKIPELLQVVHDLVRNSPGGPALPQMIHAPVRIHAGGAGYVILACTDCLRSFEVTITPLDTGMERTAACTHCGGRVPFLIESSGDA